MTVLTASGYSWTDGKFARVAHAGNWISGGTISASSTATDYSADAADTSLTYEKWKPSSLAATWENNFGGSEDYDYCCIAAHNLGTQGCTLEVQTYDTGSWTDLITATAITDDSPLFIFFPEQTDTRARIRITVGSAPEVGVVKFGSALKMQRPFYQGFSPSRMARQTSIIGNVSEGGEFLGRTTVRSSSNVEYQWNNLTYTWVRDNLDGKAGLIQSLETEPFFLAWRPSETEDVDFGWTTGPVQPPQLSGPRDLMTFGFQAQVYGYE